MISPVQRVSVVTEPEGWFSPFADQLVTQLSAGGFTACRCNRYADVPEGDVAFYLSCMRITPPETLQQNTHNLVVHASDLPKGRGFSPLVWQVLEGTNEIPLTMISMAEEADAGDVLMQQTLKFQGHELNDEMRSVLGAAIVEMCCSAAALIFSGDALPYRKQVGESTWYRRRGPADSELDPEKSLAEQFNTLRVVDNERYPAFFHLHGRRYTLRIELKEPDEPNGEAL